MENGHWMGIEELKRLVKQPESECLERCESLKNSIPKLAEAITAFSNNLTGREKPSVFFVGIKDKGEFSGLIPTDKILKDIASLQSSGNILPVPLLDIKTISIDENKVIAIQVLPSKNPPVRYKGQCFVRISSTVRVASSDEEKLLTERRGLEDLSEDMRELSGSSRESALNMSYLKERYLPSAISSEVLRENNRDIKMQLRSLRLLGPNFCPTMTSVLIAGKDPRYYFPGAYIQFARFDGQKLTDPIKDQTEISGILEDQIKEAEKVLKFNISTSLKIGGARHISSPNYAFSALSQLLRNAVIHRDYKSNAPVKVYWFSDRVEIQSPGGPYGKLNPDNFGQEGVTDYRNPVLAEALKNLGYIERFGFGLPKARQALAENGNPPLKLKANSSVVLATIFPKTD